MDKEENVREEGTIKVQVSMKVDSSKRRGEGC